MKVSIKVECLPTVLRVNAYRFFFVSLDRDEPPHIHVRRENMVAKFWIIITIIGFALFIISDLFYNTYLGSVPRKIYNIFLVKIAIVFFIFTIILTLILTIGVVKRDPVMIYGRVVNKKVSMSSSGPPAWSLNKNYQIEIASEESEVGNFKNGVSQRFYNTLDVGDRVKITYHAESITLFGISKRCIIVDSIQ